MIITLFLFLTLCIEARGGGDLFPPIEGWVLTHDSTVYTPDNLYDLIDGAADVYLSNGFVELRVAEYFNRDSIDVRVEMYRHNSPENTFGIYSQERKPGYHFLGIGAQGYIEDNVLNFLAGKYYAKLSSHASGEPVRRALILVAERIVAHLNQSLSLPAALELFPREGRIKNGEFYVARDFLGYSVLQGAYVAPYGGSGSYSLFIIPLETAAQARAMVRGYITSVKKEKTGPTEGALIVNDPNNGLLGILQEGRFIAGVFGQVDAEVCGLLLRRLQDSIQSQ